MAIELLGSATLNLQLAALKIVVFLLVSNQAEIEVEPYVRRAQKLIIIIGILSLIISIALLTWYTFVLFPPGS